MWLLEACDNPALLAFEPPRLTNCAWACTTKLMGKVLLATLQSPQSYV